VSLRRITRAEEVAGCNAVLLLGSRTVPEAAAWLQSSGIGAAIRSHAEAGGSVVGLCGGLQLLGGDIVDDGSGEGAGAGLGLLECTTRFQPAKTTVAGSATWQASDPWQALDTSFPLHGYEIHHGQTTGTEPVLMRAADGRAIAWGREACWGSYLHGTFDDDAFRRWWIDILRQRSGLVPLGSMQHRFDLEPALERFADRLEQHCDMAAIAALVAP
jgi:adenosylcobyric acid synthase